MSQDLLRECFDALRTSAPLPDACQRVLADLTDHFSDKLAPEPEPEAEAEEEEPESHVPKNTFMG